MADTFNEAVLDAMLRHQIGLLRFTGHLRNRIWRLLDATEADIREQINRRLRLGIGQGLIPANVRRMERLLAGVRETRIKAWDDVSDLWLEELRGLALAEPGFIAGTIQSAVPVELGMQLPDPAALRGIVRSTPFHGKTLSEWAQNIQRADLDRISSQIKIGMVQSEHPRQIARRIVGTVKLKGRDGVTQITRRQAEMLSRTLVNGVSAQARRELMLANADLGTKDLFVATLDSRTTPICMSLDGNIYEVGEGPQLPLHFGERSLYAPVLDGEVIGDRPIREFTQQQLVGEYADENGLGKIKGSKRGNLPRGHKASFDAFARQRMRELTGTAPAKTTYAQFLGRQTVAFQEDVLGVTRARLFRQGGLTLDRFVDASGAELSLDQLAQLHADAFRAAGLDPKAFVR